MVKKHSVSDTARTSLADLRRWPGDGVFGMKPNSGSDAPDLGVERSRNPDLGKKNPDLGAGLAGCRLRCRAGAAGLCRAAGASQPFAKKKRAAVLPPREDWNFCDIGATNVKETRLGEPVLGETAARPSLSATRRLTRASAKLQGGQASSEGVDLARASLAVSSIKPPPPKITSKRPAACQRLLRAPFFFFAAVGLSGEVNNSAGPLPADSARRVGQTDTPLGWDLLSVEALIFFCGAPSNISAGFDRGGPDASSRDLVLSIKPS